MNDSIEGWVANEQGLEGVTIKSGNELFTVGVEEE